MPLYHPPPRRLSTVFIVGENGGNLRRKNAVTASTWIVPHCNLILRASDTPAEIEDTKTRRGGQVLDFLSRKWYNVRV